MLLIIEEREWYKRVAFLGYEVEGREIVRKFLLVAGLFILGIFIWFNNIFLLLLYFDITFKS